jgi:hypothetical protein
MGAGICENIVQPVNNNNNNNNNNNKYAFYKTMISHCYQ